MTTENELRDDQFELYDLTIVVESIGGNCTCSMKVGDKFHLKGGKLSMPDKSDFCLYALQSTLPLLPTKQRKNHPADWMETDARVVCPDPECKLIMRIDRNNLRILNHDDVSPIKWKK
ncbi:TIGR04076 family protein [Maribacter flavus]|uniref:TIGR04076 family protein n=1 Tax=Maribacter flavus TaxID=1658664 RepID=UPI001B875F06|nr:TIGR04076 family protein [Maribacter flavus]